MHFRRPTKNLQYLLQKLNRCVRLLHVTIKISEKDSKNVGSIHKNSK
jgi:hypothetical protein